MTHPHSLKPSTAIHGDWHIWKGHCAWLVSDEATKSLKSFMDLDEAINWLYLRGHKEAARYFNTKFKD